MFNHLHPVAVRCDMVLRQVFRARRVRKTGIGGEVRHGVTLGASSCTPKLHPAMPYNRVHIVPYMRHPV